MKIEAENMKERSATEELVRESPRNVANHLRQGYGGQDVKVLPMAKSNCQ